MKLFDTTKKPSIPHDKWTIESNDTSLGRIDLSKLELYLDDEQKNGRYIEGDTLRKKLKDKLVLNASVLDYLYEHQELIPKSWKEKSEGYIKYIYFWGTIYRSSHGNLCVRYLYFDVGAWSRGCRWLCVGWDGDGPAALLASSPKSLKPRILELELLERVKKIEKWIDFWETVETPWNKDK